MLTCGVDDSSADSSGCVSVPRFDAACADLVVEGVVDATRAQLDTAFASHLTKVRSWGGEGDSRLFG